MGIAGAGNSGTLLATLFAPRLAERFGWACDVRLAMVPVAIVLVVFACLAKDSPRRSHAGDAARLRRGAARARHAVAVVPLQPDVRRLRRLRQLPHHVLPRAVPACRGVAPATSRRVVVVAGSLLRPVGGWLSDRFGGYRAAASCCSAAFAVVPVGAWRRCRRSAWPWRCCSSAMGLLGMGNGAVFQLVPQRFPERIGIVTGIVGAAGGLGGFFLPTLLGAAKDVTGGYAPGLRAALRVRRWRSCCSSSARAGRWLRRRRVRSGGRLLRIAQHWFSRSSGACDASVAANVPGRSARPIGLAVRRNDEVTPMTAPFRIGIET